MRGLIALILILVSSVTILLGQSAESGLPFINNFSPKQYNANTQNWAIAQDKRGVMYFGNNRGVLEYDGVSWNLIPAKNHSIVRSLAIDELGTIYVGAVGEFGYLSADKWGKLQYFSLVDQLPEEDRKFADVWSTLVKGDEVYFHTLHKLFRYKKGQFTSWPLTNSYHRSFIVHDKLYLRQDGIGLMVLEADSLKALGGGELFTHESVSVMLPLGDDIIIGSRNLGLYRYSIRKGNIEKLSWQANAFLQENLVYHGALLANGQYVFSTTKNGIILTDTSGNILHHINQETGLPYKTVYYLFSDKVNNLWLGLASGISKLEVISPISVFDKVLGLHGGILSITRFQGTLYVCTHQGVFYLNETGKFVQVEGLSTQSWQMEKFDVPHEPGKQILLVATTNGVYEVSKKGVTLIYKGRSGAVKTSPTDPYRVYVGLNGSIASLRYQNNEWVNEGSLKIIHDEIRSIKEDEKGNIWMGSMYEGVYCLKTAHWNTYLAGQNPAILDSIKNYDTSKGLPTQNWNYFYSVSNRLLVTTQKGIYRYNEKKDLFEPDRRIMSAFTDPDRWFYYVNEDENGNLWFDSDKGKGMLIKSKEGYTLSEGQFKRIIVSPENQVTGYTDEKGILWFGTPDGLFRYDSKFLKDYQQPFTAMIRKVTVGQDSTIFYGTLYQQPANSEAYHTLTASSLQPGLLKEALSYFNNSLSFHYAAPLYEQEGTSLYSHFLEGYDQHWSAWTGESRKEYTNLPEGNYRFKVRARNFYDTISQEASYDFSISPPWYRTRLAYFCYLLGLFGIITLIAKANARRLMQDNMRLEAIVATRTAEIKQQKEEIEYQKNEIEESYKHLSTLSEIGQSITATLDLKSIINTFYTSIGALMPIDAFGIGIYNEQKKCIDFQHAFQDGRELPPFSYSITDENRLAVWCFSNRKKMLINDLQQEYSKYVASLTDPIGGQHATSILYFPLKLKKKVVGVITVQSYRKNAYQPYQLDILRTLAAYTVVALDNSHAYFKLNEINEELSATLNNLKLTQTQLVQSEKMASLGQLTAGVAHEINNPINFISAGIDSLSINYGELQELLNKYTSLKAGEDNNQLLQEIEVLKKELDLAYLLEEIPLLLAGIKTGTQRTTEIVKSLRNFARLDEDSLKVTDIHEGLESTLVILRNKLGERISVERQYDAALPEILCYPGQLNQVFMNILNNAIQAIESSGQISIHTKRADDYVLVSISDTGKGMDKAVQERIFEPFFTTKEVGEGTGLGLSISYGIIEKHKGKIAVESSPGKGTHFIIHLPITGS